MYTASTLLLCCCICSGYSLLDSDLHSVAIEGAEAHALLEVNQAQRLVGDNSSAEHIVDLLRVTQQGGEVATNCLLQGFQGL
jgi:hypothetical protein